MDFDRYREEVDTNRRKHGFDTVDEEGPGFDRLWSAHEDDPTVGSVSLFATVTDANGHDAADIERDADRLRRTVAELTDDGESATPIGYLVFALSEPGDDLVSAATSYTVAERRTNVFPLVYDTDADALHIHPVPRLKGRGIYRRQADDAERLFEV